MRLSNNKLYHYMMTFFQCVDQTLLQFDLPSQYKVKNICILNCLVFAISYFQLCKNDVYKTFYLIKKWMMLVIIYKNVFMTLPDNLVLICRFEDHNLVFCLLYMICEIYFFLLKCGP